MENTLTIPPREAVCPSSLPQHVGVFLWKKDGWPIYRCTSCQHMWVSPLPTPEVLQAFYDRGYFEGDASKRGYADYDRDKESVKDDFVSYLRQIEVQQTERGSQKRLLDIGAATGFFCRLAMERGWQAVGVELSAYAAGLGQERGLDIREGTFEQHASSHQGVNAITAWDVVEHLPDPFAFFSLAKATLAPGGVLMCALPQGDSRFARLLGKYWTLLAPPQHLHYFSLKSVRRALDDAGFEVQSIEWHGKNFSLGYILHFVLGWLKLDWPWIARLTHRPFLNRFHFHINPHDMMIVMAKVKIS